MSFEVILEDDRTQARLGRLSTPHGDVETPVFMDVGTCATVKALEPRDLVETGVQVVLGNTYHLMLRPGAEVIAAAGGLHRFMRWDGPLLTDSGGFQVFSLAKMRKLTEDGCLFNSHIDGHEFFLGPKESMAMQRVLGSDIAMAFAISLRLSRYRIWVADSPSTFALGEAFNSSSTDLPQLSAPQR